VELTEVNEGMRRMQVPCLYYPAIKSSVVVLSCY